MSLFSYSVTVSACAGPRIEPSTVSINHNCNFLEVTQFRGCVKREWALIPNAPSSVPNLPYVSCRPKTQQCFFVFLTLFKIQDSRLLYYLTRDELNTWLNIIFTHYTYVWISLKVGISDNSRPLYLEWCGRPVFGVRFTWHGTVPAALSCHQPVLHAVYGSSFTSPS